MARSLENMLKSERRLCMREVSDLSPLDDIPVSFFCVLRSLGFPAAASRRLACHNRHREPFFRYRQSLSFKQKIQSNNKGFYWMVTICCLVFTPPLESCAVTVMMLSPVGKELVKWWNPPSLSTTASCPFTITRAPGSVRPRT